MMFQDGSENLEAEHALIETNKFDLLQPLDHEVKEPMDDSTLLSMTDSSQDDTINEPKSFLMKSIATKRVSKIQRPKVFRKQPSILSNTSLQTQIDVPSRSNGRFYSLQESFIPHTPSSSEKQSNMITCNKTTYHRALSAPQMESSHQVKKQSLLSEMKSRSYNGRAEPGIPLDRLMSQFHGLQVLQRDQPDNMKNINMVQITDRAKDDMEHCDICSSPCIIEFQNIMSILVRNRYKRNGEFLQINSKETGLNDFLIMYRENTISAKELAQEIMLSLFRQNLPKDVSWEIADILSREIVLPVGEKGYSVFIEAREVSENETVRTSSVTGRVLFVFDRNEIHIENYSLISSTFEPAERSN
jgi:hypothetical protein